MRANSAANARKVLPVLAVLALQGLTQAQTLNEVIDNVKSNELLYNNYDVHAIHTYRLGTALAPLPGVIVGEHKEARTVIQGDLFYFEAIGSNTQLDKQKINVSIHSGYDGEWMRLNENEEYGNMANWRREDPRLFRPHGVFIRPWTGAPLSVFIQGGDSLSKHPLNGSYSEFRLSPTVEGFEDVDGDRCVKIRIVTRDKSGERTVGKTILYINTTKNYLPHKHLVFNPPDSQRPVSDRQVESFQRTEGGLWFPAKVRHTNYSTGHTMIGEYYTEVKSVALKVNYDKSLFSNIKFADHRPVYIFKNGTLDGKFFPGGESAQAPNSIWGAGIIVGVVALLSAGLFLLNEPNSGKPGLP